MPDDVSPGSTLGSTPGFATGVGPGTGLSGHPGFSPTATPAPTFAPEDALNIITAKWNALGGEPGPAITPGIAGIHSVAEPPCWFQEFANGIIYREGDKAFYVKGAILARYRELGGPTSFLGRPRTDELASADGAGRETRFEHGEIVFSNETGAVEVPEQFLDHWIGRGGVNSYLGYPTKGAANGLADFERGAVHVQDQFIFDSADARVIDPGQINVDGAAANAHVTLTVSASGSWEYKGQMRTSGVLSHDVFINTVLDFKLPDGRVLAWAASGDVEGTFIIGGDRVHKFHQFGMDLAIKDNWRLVRSATATTFFKVDFGVGDLAQLVGSVIGVPVAIVLLMVGGAMFSDSHTACGEMDRERFDPITGDRVQTRGVRFVRKGQPCPPGTIPPPP